MHEEVVGTWVEQKDAEAQDSRWFKFLRWAASLSPPVDPWEASPELMVRYLHAIKLQNPSYTGNALGAHRSTLSTMWFVGKASSAQIGEHMLVKKFMESMRRRVPVRPRFSDGIFWAGTLMDELRERLPSSAVRPEAYVEWAMVWLLVCLGGRSVTIQNLFAERVPSDTSDLWSVFAIDKSSSRRSASHQRDDVTVPFNASLGEFCPGRVLRTVLSITQKGRIPSKRCPLPVFPRKWGGDTRFQKGAVTLKITAILMTLELGNVYATSHAVKHSLVSSLVFLGVPVAGLRKVFRTSLQTLTRWYDTSTKFVVAPFRAQSEFSNRVLLVIVRNVCPDLDPFPLRDPDALP